MNRNFTEFYMGVLEYHMSDGKKKDFYIFYILKWLLDERIILRRLSMNHFLFLDFDPGIAKLWLLVYRA